MTDRAYARISLDTKVSGSITKQRGHLRKAAHGEPEWYIDESVSGSKVPFAERPAGKRLLADLERGDRVLVTKIDRAARNVRDLLSLVETIEARGASIVFTEQNIDTAGPMGRLLLTLLGAIAEFEAALIAERRRESLASFREEGRHAVGRAPYGLRSVSNPNGRGLVLRPHPVEGPRLRKAVERILAGESQRRLAKEIGMGEPAFGRLLRNERLAGVLGTGPDGVRLDPEQALFSLVEWRRLQEHLARPPKGWTPRTEGYGPAFACGVCGDRLYLDTSKKKAAYATYRCRGVKHASGQPAASVTRVNADRFVEKEFLARFGDLPVFEEITTDSSAARDEAVARARLSLDKAKEALDAANDEDEEEERFQAYRRAKEALRAAQALPTETVTSTVETGQTFREAWGSSSDQERTALLLRFGPWIVEPGRLPLDQKVHLAEGQGDYLAGQIDPEEGESRGPAA